MSTSIVWEFFEKPAENGKSKCTLCEKAVAFDVKKKSTKNLLDHLKRHHPKEFSGSKKSQEQAKGKEQIAKYLEPSKEIQIEAENTMARIILRNNTAFSLAEDPDMRSLFTTKFPSIKV